MNIKVGSGILSLFDCRCFPRVYFPMESLLYINV